MVVQCKSICLYGLFLRLRDHKNPTTFIDNLFRYAPLSRIPVVSCCQSICSGFLPILPTDVRWDSVSTVSEARPLGSPPTKLFRDPDLWVAFPVSLAQLSYLLRRFSFRFTRLCFILPVSLTAFLATFHNDRPTISCFPTWFSMRYYVRLLHGVRMGEVFSGTPVDGISLPILSQDQGEGSFRSVVGLLRQELPE